mmetsp:Transcript_35157/g.75004  ORF Transcript_35157/g.75004 Transcript_35157/m.75004 type:complete len:89 (-) Transcript_35157:70-336(-)
MRRSCDSGPGAVMLCWDRFATRGCGCGCGCGDPSDTGSMTTVDDDGVSSRLLLAFGAFIQLALAVTRDESLLCKPPRVEADAKELPWL